MPVAAKLDAALTKIRNRRVADAVRKMARLAPEVNAFGPKIHEDYNNTLSDEGLDHSVNPWDRYNGVHSHDILADYLADHGDPREDIVRRRSGLLEFYGKGYQFGDHSTHQFPDQTEMTVHPVGHPMEGYPIAYMVNWGGLPSHSEDNSKIPWYRAKFTPDEFHNWLNRFDEDVRPRLAGINDDNEPEELLPEIPPLDNGGDYEIPAIDEIPPVEPDFPFPDEDLPEIPREYARAVRRHAAGPHPDEVAFHRAMEDDPNNETTALVYADWLDDRGRSGLSGAIREHIARNPIRREQIGETGIVPVASEIRNSYGAEDRSVRIHYATDHPDTKFGKDGMITYVPMAHDPSKILTLQTWTPRHRTMELLSALAREGFPIHNDGSEDNGDRVQSLIDSVARPQQLARRYAAYRAPAGGMVARGTYYKGGSMVPDMGGEFMNPPRFDDKKLKDARKKWKAKKVKHVPGIAEPDHSGDNPTGTMVVSYARAVGVVQRYSHDAFQKTINRQPQDSNPRAIYADWIEENDPQSAAEGTLDFLRTHHGPAWVGRGPDGKVYAGRRWTMPEIRRYMDDYGSHWFGRAAMSFFGTMIHGQPYHGPGGIFFITSEQPPHGPRSFTVRSFQPARAMIGEGGDERMWPPTIASFVMGGHRDLPSARAVARRMASGFSVDRSNPDHMAGNFSQNPPPSPERLARAVAGVVKKFARHDPDLVGLFQAARSDPYEANTHAAIADRLEELNSNDPISQLIREQYGLAGGPAKENLWHDPFYNSWDGTFPYAARLGKHGPFNLYLAHESPPYEPRDLAPGRTNQQSPNSRWILHAVSTMPGSQDSGYTFEFPHEEAHRIPRMFPDATSFIDPRDSALHWPSMRHSEAADFDNLMDRQQRDRE